MPINTRPHAMIAGLALVIALAMPAAAIAKPVDVEGAHFDDPLEIDGHRYRLIGSGLFTYMIWDAYAGAYYQVEGERQAAPLTDVPRRLTLEYFHALKAADIAEATRKGVRRNVDAATYQAVRQPLKAFNASYRDVQPGDRYTMAWTGNALLLSLNGKQVHRSSDPQLARALFAIWFGDQPADADFKHALLGR